MSNRRISLAEPVTELKRIPILECGEELVDFLDLCPALVLDRPRFKYTRATLLRRSVAERLRHASTLLPNGFRLAVIEGWRPPHIQRRMYLRVWQQFKERNPEWSETRLRRVVNRYTAPMNSRVPPPHTTGGAIDVLLADSEGRALNHQAPYERYDPAGYSFDAPGITPDARRHRDILAEAMHAAGITNYPSEYWHWSYGDQGWAYRGSHPNAIYNATQPNGWTPSSEEAIDAPLEWAEVN